MGVLLLAIFLAVSAATVVRDDGSKDVLIGKESLVNADVKVRELCILKLLNHILQPTMYEDIHKVAHEYILEENTDKYLKTDVVKKFIETFKTGMLPRGEFFVHSNDRHLTQAIKVFNLLYFAKDFDVFIKTCCWLRERINSGMFVYALTTAVFHRVDCRGIILPAPYEIYPYLFVNSDVIQKTMIMKMTKKVTDHDLANYWGIRVTDKNVCYIDSRFGLRHTMGHADKLAYFTEDIDLNTYLYYLHMSYPHWMDHDEFSVQKERRGEVTTYIGQQLLARLRLERLSHGMCDIKMLKWDEKIKDGYWPKIRLHTGDEMPARQGGSKMITEDKLRLKLILDDIESILRQSILKGRAELRDGTVITLKKPEDFEYLARLIVGGISKPDNHGNVIHFTNMIKKIFTYSMFNIDKNTYIPTAIDMYMTALRDPLFWQVWKRLLDMCRLFKDLMPKYTRDELNFPGVKIETVTTDKLVTFVDEYDMDITNAVFLDDSELQKKKSDMLFVARQRRLNHHPFKVTVDVASDKAVDAVVRIFLGPKYDCMGRLININDKRLEMIEIDSFLHKLDTGKNTIVRTSTEMHNVIQDRPWTRHLLDHNLEMSTADSHNRVIVDGWWHKTRHGFPARLLLPLGHRGGFELQLFVVVTPVRTGLTLPIVDQTVMKDRHTCFFTTCIDTMPLGFPFDREIDVTHFFTPNMKFVDVLVFRKDMDLANINKEVDTADMVLRRDDLTFLDSDMLVRWSYKDLMLTHTHKTI